MKFVLAAVLCALMVKTVILMPVAEPGTQSDQLAVVPLENGAPVPHTQHILRRQTSESDAAETSVHHEGETPEEHAKHAHLPTARLEQDAAKTESVKAEEPKPLSEEVKSVETVVAQSEKKEEVLLKKEQVIEDVVAAKAAIAEIMTPAETLAPIPAVPVASVPVEDKVEPQVTEGKNAPTKDIKSELKEVVGSEENSPKATEKTEEPQQIAKSLPDSTKSEAASVIESIATVAAAVESEPLPKDEKKIEPVVAESEQKIAEQPKEGVKEAEDKTDRVTRGTEEAAPVDSVQAAPVAQLTSAPAPAESAAAVAVAEPKVKLVDEIKEEKAELAEKKLDVAEAVGTSENAEKSALAKSSETILTVEASESVASVAAVEKSEKVAEEAVTSEVKAAEQTLEAKSAPSGLEAQAEAQPSAAAAAAAAVAPTEIKPEPIVDTIKVKAESTEASKESTEAVKAEDSSSSEEKSSEEDRSDEKSEKSSGGKSSGEEKKEESKVEELPKPQEIKEIKKDE